MDRLDIRSKIVTIASAELGVREATGKNDGKRVEEYLAYTNLGKGHAWCAAFVSWVYGQAGLSQPRNPWSPALFPTARTYWKQGRLVDNGRYNYSRCGMSAGLRDASKRLAQTSSLQLFSMRDECGAVGRIKMRIIALVQKQIDKKIASLHRTSPIASVRKDGIREIVQRTMLESSSLRGSTTTQSYDDKVAKVRKIASRHHTRPIASVRNDAEIQYEIIAPADIFGIYGHAAKRINHVGLVKKTEGNYIVTIEGNSNNKVESRRRHISTIYAVADWINK